MRVTTVASVRSKIIFSKKIDYSSYYEVYSIATTSFTPPHTLTIPQLYSISTTTCETQQLTRTEHLPKTRASLNESRYFTSHSIDTFSFTSRYALDIPPPHFISATSNETQQSTRTDLLPHRRFLSLLDLLPHRRFLSLHRPHR